MSKLNHYSHLAYAILYLVLSVFGFIFPSIYGQYLTIIVGGILIIIGIMTLIDNLKLHLPLAYVVPLIYIVTGLLLIVLFNVIVSFLMILAGIVLILLGLSKTKQISYYTALNKKPIVPIMLTILYVLFGVAIIVVASLANQNPDLYYQVLGYIVATGFALLFIYTLVKFIKKDDEDLHFIKITPNDDSENNPTTNNANPDSKVIDAEITDEKIIDNDDQNSK